ncbi:hypothetical protein [Devosia ginsengisoli]|uniref:hypothetical protein n=1 Tax=Devosia ginsengisoli TaxID=400770 RepID=UPI0026EE8D90|nr:hypothetical protein [Devosia ginsengisoli]MCR6670707.1 hypothetical protein [Devosia ginsengisoli]
MESGPSFWLIVLTLGVVILGAAMAYGLYRNRQRSRAEKALTEAATHAEYEREDRDSS